VTAPDISLPTVAVLHNLPSGGAHRRLVEHVRHLGLPVVEIRLEGAEPVTQNGTVIPLHWRGETAPRWRRPLARHVDIWRLAGGWRRAASTARAVADLMYVNPCRLMQSPWALHSADDMPAVYFADEPRRLSFTAPPDVHMLPGVRRGRYVARNLAIYEMDRRAYRKASTVLTNSRYTANWLVAAYRTHIPLPKPIPMGIPDEILADDPVVIGREDFLLMSTAVVRHKRVHLGLEAAARVGRPLKVAGRIQDENYAATLTRQADGLGVEMELLGELDISRLKRFYQRAFALMSLSPEEPLGLASLEAQSTGCPVIVSDRGGLPETVLDPRAGILVPESAEAVADAIHTLEDAQRHQDASRAASTSTRHLGWQHSSDLVRERLIDAARGGASR
jgi:glycosyltransferase involved in cell wall biosynthesis